MEGILVAIDGPAGSGKSSVARAVAARLGVVNLNTGAAYRAVALLALERAADVEDAGALAELAREVELLPDGVRIGGAEVVEGRDIGTVVLPDADLKVFLQAAPEERARRRARQTGREDELERIQAAMKTRDRQDSERQSAPLKAAEDAVVLDTTGLSLPDVVQQVLDLAEDVRTAKQGA
jgi:CMP/dCMP kinase